MTDTIHTVTLTPQEQAAFESGRKIGWNEGIEASAKLVDEAWNFRIVSRLPDAIRALSMPAPAQAWRVKPLVWAGEEDDYAEVNEFDLRYLLMDPSSADECNGWYVLEESTNTVIEADGSIEAAKAAAQADYAARILAALIPDTEGDA